MKQPKTNYVLWLILIIANHLWAEETNVTTNTNAAFTPEEINWLNEILSNQPQVKPNIPILAGINVVADNTLKLTGAGTRIHKDRITKFNSANINEILKTIPGVYSREEDGYGLFQNVSLRGVFSGRSQKVTLMEDGILIAPAPYSAPAAYISPSPGNKTGIEVLKGGSQLRYGPQTTGGVINYLTESGLKKSFANFNFSYGSVINKLENEIKTGITAGKNIDLRNSKLYLLGDVHFHRSDGFQYIQEKVDFTNGTQTGFYKIDPVLKISFKTKSLPYQTVSLKLGYSRVDANSSYLGLTSQDVINNPYRRYAISRFDRFLGNQYKSHLNYLLDEKKFSLNISGYFAWFDRIWSRLAPDNNGLLNPNRDQLVYRIYNGEANGVFTVLDNYREYINTGLQAKIKLKQELKVWRNTLEIGGRFHYDNVYRRHRLTQYEQNQQGRILYKEEGDWGYQLVNGSNEGHNEEQSRAISIYLLDRLEVGKWIIEPGVRMEIVEATFLNYQVGVVKEVIESGKKTAWLDNYLFGIGLVYSPNRNNSVVLGVNQGLGLPSPRGIINGVKSEKSLSSELGFKHHSLLKFELIGFLSYFENLILNNNFGGGGTLLDLNAGHIISVGAELVTELDLLKVFNRTKAIGKSKTQWSLPIEIVLTYTQARFLTDLSTQGQETHIYSGARVGHKVPYIPEWLIYTGISLLGPKIHINLKGTFTGGQFSTAHNSMEPINNQYNPGETQYHDITIGYLKPYFLLDASIKYKLTPNHSLVLVGKNLLNQVYVTSLHPNGSRLGRALSLELGVELKF